MNIEKSRASWQAEPCPSWCARVHHDDDHPDDRYHDSDTTVVPAVMADRDRLAGAGRWTHESAELAIVTSRYDESTQVVTFIGRDDRPDQHLVMTPESAKRLAQALVRHLAMVAEGR